MDISFTCSTMPQTNKHKSKQNKTKQNKTKQNKTKQNKTNTSTKQTQAQNKPCNQRPLIRRRTLESGGGSTSVGTRSATDRAHRGSICCTLLTAGGSVTIGAGRVGFIGATSAGGWEG